MTDVQTTWRQLSEGISQIMAPVQTGLSYQRYMELYTLVYNHCTASRTPTSPTGQRGANLMGGDLYQLLANYLKTFLLELLQQSVKFTDEALLSFYSKQWRRYTMGSTLIHHIFRYLNRHWVKREIDEGHKNIYDIYTLSLVSWKDHFFKASESQVMSAVFKMVQKQREGEAIDTSLIKTIVDSFVALGMDENDPTKSTLDIYVTYFEQPFVNMSFDYYLNESQQFLSEHSVTDYMKKVEQRLLEEEDRISMFLHPNSRKPLISACEEVMVRKPLDTIQAEFQKLLDHDRYEDLHRMYGLLNRLSDGLDNLRIVFEAHVKRNGLEAVEKAASEATANEEKNPEEEEEEGSAPKRAKRGAPAEKSSDIDPKLYVDTLLSVHKKNVDLVQQSLVGNAGFVASLDKACREFVNRNHVCKSSSSKSPELLARYCDSILRKGSKVSEDGEVEEILNQVMIVFKYVEDKDVFQKFYSKMLARRLVNGNSANDDAEASMISKLKEACGYEYTSKLQRMFSDIGLSKDLNEKFKSYAEEKFSKEELLDFGVLVLVAGSWPLQAPTTKFNSPPELQMTMEKFTQFYNHQHSGRKLTWLFQLCKGELKTQYLPIKVGYTFQVSTYQMGILLMYNNAISFSWEEILESTGLNPDVLQGQLGILLKAKVLLLSDGSKVGESNSQYSLNFDFKSKKIRVNLNMPIKSEQKTEIEETHKTVEEDRKLLIQAAIVRIMKARKVLKHVTLMNEVISQLQTRFKPKVQDIKKCIDILLDKEYIERKEGEKDVYNYVA